jgi:predicted RNA-binding protein (virulence factor B family)
VNKPFKGRPYRVLKVGAFILTDDMIRCFVHETEQVREPRLGELVEGRIIGITEIGDINGSLLPRSYERMDEDSQVIFDYLVGRGGEMPITDKSTPEEIEKRFGMSKASFKRAMGRLMKQEKITQENGWTKAIQIPDKTEIKDVEDIEITEEI